MKDVNDEIHEIQKDPPGPVKPLYMKGAKTAFGHLLNDVLGNGTDLDIGVPSGENKKIRCRGDAPQIQGHHILGPQFQRQPGGPRHLPWRIFQWADQPSSGSTLTSISTSTSG